MTTMENQISHEVELSDRQIEFLVKCIDISSSIEDLKPDFSESEIISFLDEDQPVELIINYNEYNYNVTLPSKMIDSIYEDLIVS